MLISNLQKMEEIVLGNPQLDWEGWDVVMYKKNHSAQFNVNGVYKDGDWYNKYTYPITEDGWSIPERLVR
jgi:hypothetical protein